MKSFLKWAGGKGKILDFLYSYFPESNNFFEPFCGSGIVSLNSKYENCYLFDINNDLINTFNVLYSEKERFIGFCKDLFIYKNEEDFYKIREDYNNTKDLFLKAAFFIYLNRHCFNGLCRYNKKGFFNVPYGKYKEPYFPEKELYYFLSRTNLHFFNDDYKKAFEIAKSGDFIYCDPPYSPIKQITNFSSYTKEGFSFEDHLLLKNKIEEAKENGIKIIISNHDTDFTRELYKKADKIIFIEVQRTISSKERNKVKELIALYGIK